MKERTQNKREAWRTNEGGGEEGKERNRSTESVRAEMKGYVEWEMERGGKRK